MLLRWMVIALLAGTLALPVQAEEKDAPLLFDDPSSATVIPPKKPSKAVKARKPSVAKSGKKAAAKPVVQQAAKKPVAKKKAR